MGMRISTNVASINAQRSMANSQREIQKSFAQLSSGNRITKASDDSAGLGISENLKSTTRSYSQAQRNANDGISMVQVAEGGLGEVSTILTRLRELAIQSSSDTVGDRERSFIDKEVQQLKQESQRISTTTRFGSTNLLDGSANSFDFQVGINNVAAEDRIKFDAGLTNSTNGELGIESFDFSTKVGAQEALTANDALVILFDPNGPNTFEPVTKDAVNAFSANDDVVANELDIALELDTANDAVPNNEPVKEGASKYSPIKPASVVMYFLV
jgi:flagellin